MSRSGMSAAVRVKGAAVVVAVAAAATLAGPAAPASAGGKCRPGLCSQTWNDSGKGFHAWKNWCKSKGTTGSWTTKKPTCGNQKKSYLSPGERTPGKKDWDVFQVRAGHCYDVDFELTPGWDFNKKFDRRGKKTIWVKVADNGFAKVRSVSTRHC